MSYASVGLGQDYSTPGITVNLSDVGGVTPISSLPTSSFMNWLDNLPFLSSGSAGGGATAADENVANAALTPGAPSSSTASTASTGAKSGVSSSTLSWGVIAAALLGFALVVRK